MSLLVRSWIRLNGIFEDFIMVVVYKIMGLAYTNGSLWECWHLTGLRFEGPVKLEWVLIASTFLRSQLEVVFSSMLMFSLQKYSRHEIQWFPDVLDSLFKSRAVPSFNYAMFKKIVVLVGNLNENGGLENCSHESYLG